MVAFRYKEVRGFSRRRSFRALFLLASSASFVLVLHSCICTVLVRYLRFSPNDSDSVALAALPVLGIQKHIYTPGQWSRGLKSELANFCLSSSSSSSCIGLAAPIDGELLTYSYASDYLSNISSQLQYSAIILYDLTFFLITANTLYSVIYLIASLALHRITDSLYLRPPHTPIVYVTIPTWLWLHACIRRRFCRQSSVVVFIPSELVMSAPISGLVCNIQIHSPLFLALYIVDRFFFALLSCSVSAR